MAGLAGRKAAYFTLGCKLNFAETSSIAARLAQQGMLTAADGEAADVCIVNTCSVTEVANQKCRQAIRKMVKGNPGALVVVTGCYAQLNAQQVSAIEGVDLVLGSEQKGQIVERIAERLAMTPDERRLAAHEFLKVQDGCDYYCTYCTIPFARGRSRNGSIASIVEQAREAAKKGGKEIVITGVNIGDFGRTTGETFLDLVKALDAVEGIERYRISSIEPNLLTDEVIAYCAQSRAFMPHFHIPLQCGSDDVLRLMHRRYDTDLFRHKVQRVHELMPDAFIGVDVIVGTRGETDAFFEDAYRFMNDLDVAQYHVFSYSERPGTKALQIPHVVRSEEKHARSQRVLALSDEKLHGFYQRFLGQVRPVLLEHSRQEGVLYGFTDNYIRVEVHTDEALDNTVQSVRLTAWNDDRSALIGTIE